MISNIPREYRRPLGDLALVAAAAESGWAKASAARRAARTEAETSAEKSSSEALRDAKYSAQTQPRDTDGKFRKILARLKTNLGEEATEDLASQIEATEAAQVAGNYAEMRKHGGDLIKMLNEVDTGSITKGTANNLRRGAEDLGKIMAYLPLPQGHDTAKVRFTDLPPASNDLVRTMVQRAKDNLEPDVAEKYILELESFMSGARMMTSDEMSVYLNKLLRVIA